MADTDDLAEKLIDQAILALWPKVQQGDPKAIDRMLRLVDRKAARFKPLKRYKMSRKAIRQRRLAALKTGEYASLPTGQMMKTARGLEDAVKCGAGFAVDEDLVNIFERAMNNDPEALRHLTAGQLAALTQLLLVELAQLQDEGMAQLVPLVGGDGEPMLDEDGEVVLRAVGNPRSDAVLRLAKLLGISADDQRITPKSQGEGDLNDATTDVRKFMLESFRRTEAALKARK